MTMITPSYLGETIEYSSLHACRSTLEDPTLDQNSRMGHYQYSLLLAREGKREESAKQMEIAKQLEGERKNKTRTDLYLLNPY